MDGVSLARRVAPYFGLGCLPMFTTAVSVLAVVGARTSLGDADYDV